MQYSTLIVAVVIVTLLSMIDSPSRSDILKEITSLTSKQIFSKLYVDKQHAVETQQAIDNNQGLLKSSLVYDQGTYIQSALFNEEIQHFDDLYLIYVTDGGSSIVIFCNRKYCYRPEDAQQYA